MTDDKIKENDNENLKYKNQVKISHPHQESWKDKFKSLGTEDVSGLSKNQQKKLMKKKLFLETRPERRKLERERKKIKRAMKREAGLPLPNRRSKKRRNLQYSKLKVVIDLDFHDFMNERDLRMIVKQVKSCYSTNRKSVHPLQLNLSSFDGKLKELFYEIQPGSSNWDIKTDKSHYTNLYDRDSIVYLTSDSENILNTLDEDKVYVIGGLVDHNQHKGLCHRLAKEHEVAHAQLPIDQFIKMNTRKVLAINHVFEILLNCSETNNWKDAFYKVIPNRKVSSNAHIEESSAGGDEDDSRNVVEDHDDNVSVSEETLSGSNDEQCSEEYVDNSRTDC